MSLHEVTGKIDKGRKILVSPTTRRVPEIVTQLIQWHYAERSIHRLMAAWGRYHTEWEDKAALHRHIWDQAEVIRRLRERIKQFPGGKPDMEIHPAFENLYNLALQAPSFEDALDGIYSFLLRAQVRAYAEHVQNAHPVHDAPSISMLHEVNTVKEQHYFWYRDYRRRNPHTANRRYAENLEAAIADIGNFLSSMPEYSGSGSALCGVNTSFQLPRYGGVPKGWAPDFDIMPYLRADFCESAETRRLFWAIGYMREISLPDAQLRWLYYGHCMPWEWAHDVSRHLWDESRHGCSGLSRLQDWGISIHDVGLAPAGADAALARHTAATPSVDRLFQPFIDENMVDFSALGDPMTPQNLYEEIFSTGMIAETAHFIVKNESYDDFREGHDLESAEMMLFDIIDETTHVQYAHRWLPIAAEHAQIDNTDYKQRAVRMRAEAQQRADAVTLEAQSLPRTAGFAPWDHYQDLLQRIRRATPFLPTFSAPRRSPKPT